MKPKNKCRPPDKVSINVTFRYFNVRQELCRLATLQVVLQAADVNCGSLLKGWKEIAYEIEKWRIVCCELRIGNTV
jgi:hypothetical protein